MNTTEQDRRRALGLRMRRLRKAAGKTASDVAAAWGCNRSNVSHVENGKQSVSLDKLRAFAALVAVDLTQLLDEPTAEELAAVAEETSATSGEAA